MGHIELYVREKSASRSDIPRKILDLAMAAVSKKAAQRIIKEFLSSHGLPRRVC